MTIKILISVALGIGVGYFALPSWVLSYTDIVIDIGLCVLLFFVGIDIGKQKDVFVKIKNMGFKILLIPLMIIIGSIVGSILGGFILKMPMNESGAVGAGLGWYTLSPILLSSYSNELSALAFLSNVVREIIGIISVPIIARKIGYIESIAPCGAAGMDTLLPVVSNSTDPQTAIICFISGVICTTAVPMLVPIIIKL